MELLKLQKPLKSVMPANFDKIAFIVTMLWFLIDTGLMSWWTATSQDALAIYERPFAGAQRTVTVALQIAYIVSNYGYLYNALRANVMLFAICLLCVLSVIWSVNTSMTLSMSFRLAILCMTVSAARERHGAIAIAHTVPPLILTLLIINLGAFLFPSVSYMSLEHEGAFRGFTNHKNMLGLICGVGVASGLAGMAHQSWRPSSGRIIYPLMLALAVLMAALSHSAASLGVCIAIILLEPIRRLMGKFDSSAVPNILTALAIFAAAAITISGALDFFLGLLGRDATFSQRSTIWSLVIRYILKEPIVGYGINAFPLSTLLAKDRLGGYMFVVGSTHNSYLDILLGVGLVGFFLYIAYLVSLVVRAQNNRTGYIVFAPYFAVYVLSGLTESYGGIAPALLLAVLLMTSPEKMVTWNSRTTLRSLK